MLTRVALARIVMTSLSSALYENENHENGHKCTRCPFSFVISGISTLVGCGVKECEGVSLK